MKNKKTFLAVKCTQNNTIIHATIPNKKNIIISTGMVGFKAGKRSAPYATQKVAEVIGAKLRTNKVKKIVVIFTGFGTKKSKRLVIKGLKKKKIKIFKILYKTSLPHNGCRSKKKRRL